MSEQDIEYDNAEFQIITTLSSNFNSEVIENLKLESLLSQKYGMKLFNINPNTGEINLIKTDEKINDDLDYGTDMQMIIVEQETTHLEKIISSKPATDLCLCFFPSKKKYTGNESLLKHIQQLYCLQENSLDNLHLAIESLYKTVVNRGVICTDFSDVRAVFSDVKQVIWWVFDPQLPHHVQLEAFTTQTSYFINGFIKTAFVVMHYNKDFSMATFSDFYNLLELYVPNNTTGCISAPYNADLEGKYLVFLGG